MKKINEISKPLASETDTLRLAAQLAHMIDEGTVIFLYGPLGAGKTTFTRGFLHGLGYEDKVKSPTYTLVEPYDVEGRMIYHFDLYRLTHPSELEHIGIQEYFSPSSICLIEWPEKGMTYLPEPDLACHLSFVDGGREIKIEAHSHRGIGLLKKL